MHGKRFLALLAALGILLLAGTSRSALASSHRHVAVQVGVAAPTTVAVVDRQWIPGHYETTSEKALVAAGHYRTDWVPPKYKTLYDKRGREYRVKVRDGFHRKVWVEPVYETRVVKTWVPGHHVRVVRHVPAPCHPVVVHRPVHTVCHPHYRHHVSYRHHPHHRYHPHHKYHGKYKHCGKYKHHGYHHKKPHVGFGISVRF